MNARIAWGTMIIAFLSGVTPAQASDKSRAGNQKVTKTSLEAKASALIKAKDFKGVVDLYQDRKDRTAQDSYLYAVGLLRMGQFEKAYEVNNTAVATGHLNAMYNNICIAALKGNRDVAYHWFAELRESTVNQPELRKKYAALAARDGDLDFLRKDVRFKDIMKLFTGDYRPQVIPETDAKFAGNKFAAEEKISWRGIVLHLPDRIKIKSSGIELPAKAFSMTAYYLGRFEEKREFVGKNLKTGKIYRSFYGPSYGPEFPDGPDIAAPFNPPKLTAADGTDAAGGGRLDFIMGKDLPAEPATYEFHIETTLYRSNKVKVAIEK
jgi:hypothetical protein